MLKRHILALLLVFFVISINTPYCQAAAPFEMQLQEGEFLVKQFEAAFNRKPFNLKKIQEQAFRISQHYQAKFLLKNKYPDIGKIYHNVWKKGSYSLNSRIIEKAKQKLRQKNYSGKAVEGVEPIQNKKSLQSASAPMDLDAGVQTRTSREIQEFIEELGDQGKTPKGYIADLQQALEEAYEEVARDVGAFGMDPEKAFVTGTAAWHPDAYKDLDVLSGKAPGKELIQQSADVSKNKIYEFHNMARAEVISPEAAIQEAGRGVQKDMSKMNTVFDEIENISGYRPRLSNKNQQVLGLLDGLKELKDPNIVKHQIEALTGKNYFDALADLMDNLESTWKLAPTTKAQGMVTSIMKKVLSDTEFEYFISKYKIIGMDNLTGKAGQVAQSLKKMCAARLLSMQDSASAFVSNLKGQYPKLSKAGDDVIDLMNYVKKTATVDDLADIVGKSTSAQFAKIKTMLSKTTMGKIAGRYMKNTIPLPSIDKKANQLLLGEVDGNLRMETFMGAAMALYEMNDIIDKDLPPGEENQQLAEAFARNLPIVGDFFQGAVEGHQAYLEGDKKKMAMAGAYLFIGAAGLVPGGQVPALIAGLGMVSISLGGSAWDTSKEKALIEAWLDSGDFDPKPGTLKGLWTKSAGLRDIRPDQLLNTSDLYYDIGLDGITIQVSIHDWGERYFVKNQSNVPLLRLAFKNIYPDFDLDATLREPYNTARSQLAAKILETGGNPSRDVGLGIFLQLKRIQDQAADQALYQIKEIVEKEYQAKHFTGKALEIYRKLKELGGRMSLPLLENTQNIFKSFSSFVTKSVTFPWVRDSLSVQEMTLQKRYYDGFLEIEERIKNIRSNMEEVGLNPPASFHLTGFLEIDGPRMKDLENAYLVKGIGQARKDAAAIHKAAGMTESFDMKKDCGKELFVTLAKIQMSLVHRRDLKLLMAQWQGKKSAATASRDAEFERVKQSVTDSRLPSSVWDTLSRKFEATYAWTSASLPGSGGYEVYSDAQYAIQIQISKLEKQYEKTKDISRDEYIACTVADVDLKLTIEKAEQKLGGSDDDAADPDEGGEKDVSGDSDVVIAEEDSVKIGEASGGQETKGNSDKTTQADTSSESTTSSNQPLSFSGAAPSIWKGGNDDKGFSFKRKKATATFIDVKNDIKYSASVSGDIWGKFNDSFAPSNKDELLKELNERAKDTKQRFNRRTHICEAKATVRNFSIDGFEGYLLETKTNVCGGFFSWSSSASAGSTAWAEGWVFKGNKTIHIKYRISGGGPTNSNLNSFLSSQTKAGQSEAQDILAGLHLSNNGKFSSTPYTGPKLDGSDMLTAALTAFPEEPSFLGDTVEVTAKVSGGKPPYSYKWSGEHGGKGAKVLFASRKEGEHQLSVTVTDARGDTVTAEITIKFEELEVTIKQTQPSSDTLIFPGRKVFFEADIKGGNREKLEYLWQPHPEVTFDPFENQLNTKAVFPAINIYKVWIQVFRREGETLTTVGESKQLEIQVTMPKIKLTVDKPNPYVGEKVTIKVQTEPKIKDDLITFWWDIKGGKTLNAGPEVNVPNNRDYSFMPKDTEPVTVTVHVKAKNGEADLGEVSVPINAKEYSIVPSEPKRLDKAPWKWDPIKGTVVELPQAIAVFQNAEVHAIITPEPKGKVSYKWTVTPEGCNISAPMSKSTNLNAHEAKTYTVTVKVSDKNGIAFGKGNTTHTVTVSQRDLDEAKQKADDQQKAQNLLKEGRKFWKEGKLQQAIAKITQAQKLAPKDQDITKTFKAMQKQKKTIDRKLTEASDLIKKGDFDSASRALSMAATINSEYARYKEVLKQLTDAKKKAEETKKLLAKLLKDAQSLKSNGKIDESIVILQNGSIQFPNNKEIEKLLKEVIKQQNDALKKMREGQAQWANGVLDKAAATLQEALKIDSSNKKCAKVLEKMQNQKKILDSTLKKADELISQKDFKQAQNALVKAGKISKEYPPYIRMIKKLDQSEHDATIAIEAEKEKQKATAKKQKTETKKRQEAEKIEQANALKKERKAARIRSLLNDAKSKWQNNERKGAIAKLDEIIVIDSTRQDVISLKKKWQDMLKEIKETEPNIAIQTPHQELETFSGTLTNDSPKASHTIMMPVDGTLNITITTGPKLNFYGGIQLKDLDGKTSMGGDIHQGPNSTKTWSFSMLRAGRYHLLLAKDSRKFYFGPYSVTISIDNQKFGNDKESNDKFETANALALNQIVSGHLGARGQGQPTDQADYWKLNIPTDGELHLDVTTSEKLNLNGGIFVYNSDKKQICRSIIQGPSSSKKHICKNIKAGTHYIEIKKDGRNFYWGSYQLKSTLVPTVNSDTTNQKNIDKPIQNTNSGGNSNQPTPETPIKEQIISAKFDAPSSANVWQHYTIPLRAEQFGVDEETFSKVLTNVNSFRIRTELYNGNDVGSLDSVRIGSQFVSKFDSGTNGWNAEGDGTMKWIATGGQSGGYLQISDWASGEWHYATAPVNWSGDWSSLNGHAIEFDFKTDHPSYGSEIEISSKQQKRLGLTATPMVLAPGGSSTLSLSPYPASNQEMKIFLKSSDTKCFIVQNDILLSSGQKSINVMVKATQDAKTCNSVITASADGYGVSRVTLSVEEESTSISKPQGDATQTILTSGRLKTSTSYTPNCRGDVFSGGHWVGASGRSDWIQKDFASARLITSVSIAKASTDVTTKGFRLVLKLKKTTGEWITIDQLQDTNINRTALSGGAIGNSIPSYHKSLASPIKATAFRLEFYGHGWFDATDIRIYHHQKTVKVNTSISSSTSKIISANGVVGNTLQIITIPLDRGKSKIIKMHITEGSELTAQSNGKKDSARIGEVEFYTNQQKIVPHKVEADSSFGRGYSIDQIIDGYREYKYMVSGTKGWASSEEKNRDSWITFYFGNEVDIQKVVVVTAPDRPYRLHSFSIIKYQEIVKFNTPLAKYDTENIDGIVDIDKMREEKKIIVTIDKNIYPDPSVTDSLADNNHYVIDGDESHAWAQLFFKDPILNLRQIRSMILKLTISTVKDGASRNGITIYHKDIVVGRVPAVARGEVVEVPLDISKIKITNGRLELILRAAGSDAAYIESKASGRGAELKIISN